MIGIVSFPFLMLAQRLDWFQSVRTFPLPNVGDEPRRAPLRCHRRAVSAPSRVRRTEYPM